MDILSMPATPRMRSLRFVLRGNTQQFRSPLSGSVQTMELLGARWLATYELPIMIRATAEAWMAFLARCNGRVGRFYAGPLDITGPRGPAGGTPLVNGANQTGTLLKTDGWTEGTQPILIGDYIAWDTLTGWRELHKVVVEPGTVGIYGYGEGGYGISGYGKSGLDLEIAPPIRESPADNAAIIITNPTCVMQLASDDEAGWDVDTALHYGIKFNAEEVFSASAT